MASVSAHSIESSVTDHLNRWLAVSLRFARRRPFLNVATERPAVCSVSVSLLSQLLGVEVVREERFQDGDGRCVFRVYEDRPIPEDQRGWKPEPAKSSS